MLTDTGRPRPHRQNPNAQLYPKNLNHLKAARKAPPNPAPVHHKQLPAIFKVTYRTHHEAGREHEEEN